MAATPFDPAQTKARDRVRKLTADTAAPYRYDDLEIANELADAGFVGDPNVDSARQAVPELDAAISLLETSIITGGESESIKQGSVTFTVSGSSTAGLDAILTNLRRRREQLVGAELGDSVIAVAQCEFPDMDPRNGWPVI